MKLKLKEIIFVGLVLFLAYLFMYFLASTLFIVFYFGRNIENKFLKFLNNNINKIGLITHTIEKKPLLQSVLQKDMIIGIFIFLLFLLLLIYILVFINSEIFKQIFNRFKYQFGINLLLIMSFNVPIFIYIIFYSSKYLTMNMKGQ